jgi:hypothetical protein
MTEIRTYHGQPVIKEPVWTWEIPLYFFTGGMAGASAGLAYLCEWRHNDVLARRAWAVSLAAVSASPALLTSDLGVPLRFLNMLRMFKVTSPMSVGSWVLSASGATTGLAAVNAWTGWFPKTSRLARPAAAMFGLPLSTYTAALIANTAVPVWHEARRLLPFVFGSGAAFSAGAAAVVVTPPEDAGPARRLAVAGAALELGMEQLMERRLGELDEVYKQGPAGKFARLARVSTVAGAALVARGTKSRTASMLGGALLCAGAVSTRWSIFKAGFQSAADPAHVIGPQRAAIERGERTGASRRRSKVSSVDPALGSPATSVSPDELAQAVSQTADA